MKKIFLSILILSMILPINTGIMADKMATVFNPVTMHRKAVIVGDKHAFDGGYVLEVAQAVKLDEGLLGGSVVTNYSKALSASINSTQSTIPVTSITTKDGHELTIGDFGNRVFLVIEPGKNKEEIVMCTGISGLTWTGCTRGLAFYGTSTASMADNRKTHQAGSQIIISNTHYVYDENVDKDSDETIAGDKIFTGIIDFQDDVDFNNLPTSTTTAPTLDGHIATKKYVDDTINAGAPNATESVKGISELATQAEMAAGTATGGTGASLLLQARYATSTGGYATTSIPVTGTDGKLAEEFVPELLNLTTGAVMASTTVTATTTLLGGTITPYPTASSSIASMGYVLETAVQRYVSFQDIATTVSRSAGQSINNLTRIVSTPSGANYAVIKGSVVLNDNNGASKSNGNFTLYCSLTSSPTSISVGAYGPNFNTPGVGYSILAQSTMTISTTTIFIDFLDFSSNSHDATLSGTAYYYR